MDFNERERLLNRITSGKFYATVTYHYNEYDVVFTDPSLPVKTQADWVYNKFYKRAKESGGLSIKDTYDILREDGRWTIDMEKELITLQDDIKVLNDQLFINRFNKSAQRAIEDTIKKGKDRTLELLRVKNQLASASIEHLAEVAKQIFIITKITEISNIELLTSTAFQENLRVYYFEENGISESQLRELARSDPWRLYWTSSKDTGTSLFPHSAVEMTNLQYLLVLWSRIYDFAFETSDRPTDDIIENDIKFDSWYLSEINKRNAEIRKNSIENQFGGGIGGREIFLPADAEGAKEVYDLNSMDSKIRIQQRQKVIAEKGIVRETELPDVRADIQMELNKKASSDVQSRS